MGATTFGTTGIGKTAADAFRDARLDALYEYGHGGYTGTIAEKESFVMCATEPMRHPDAVRLAGEIVDGVSIHNGEGRDMVADKWGPAGCVELIRHDVEPGQRAFYFFGWASE